MKQFSKSVALVTLIILGMSYGNTLHSEYIAPKIKHVPFWLMKEGQPDQSKKYQLCESPYSFYKNHEMCDRAEEEAFGGDGLYNQDFILEEDLIKIPESNQTDGTDALLEELFGESPQETEVVDDTSDADDFLKDLFGETETTQEVEADVEGAGEVDDFLNDLFGETTTEVEPVTQDINEEDEAGIDGDVDDFLKDLFGGEFINRLSAYRNSEENTAIAGKKLASTIRTFSQEKVDIQIGTVEVTGVKGQNIYNTEITNFIQKVDKDFRIDSIKNDFAKNISKVSYSLSTYMNEENDEDTTEVFRAKLIRDIKTLQKKYEVLKRKDTIVAKTLAKRGAL